MSLRLSQDEASAIIQGRKKTVRKPFDSNNAALTMEQERLVFRSALTHKKPAYTVGSLHPLVNERGVPYVYKDEPVVVLIRDMWIEIPQNGKFAITSSDLTQEGTAHTSADEYETWFRSKYAHSFQRCKDSLRRLVIKVELQPLYTPSDPDDPITLEIQNVLRKYDYRGVSTLQGGGYVLHLGRGDVIYHHVSELEEQMLTWMEE